MPQVASITFGASGKDVVLEAGAQTKTFELPALDLSRRQYLRLVIVLETADTDATDTLDIYLEDRAQDGTWNQRIHSNQFDGSLSPSAAAPETRWYTVVQDEALSGAEEAVEPTGSAGATGLAAGTVLNGPFPPLFRNKGTGTETAWRLRFVQVDANSNAAFAGKVYLYAGPEF